MINIKRNLRSGAFCGLFGALILGITGVAHAWIASPSDYPDVKVFDGQSQGARVIFDPSAPNRLVTGIVSGETCFIKSSSDGGKTWGTTVPLPQLPGATCWYSPPTFSFTADGSRLYAVYSYYRNNFFGIGFTTSTDGGATWSPPLAVSSVEESEFQSTIEMATAPDADLIYLIINCDCYFGNNIYFTKSNNLGASWTALSFIAAGSGSEVSISNASVTAGRLGDVLIAYAASMAYYDPWNTVEIVRSSDYGTSFTTSVVDQKRHFSFGSPIIRIDVSGTAHIVYLRNAGSRGSSAILYKYSLQPYSVWSTWPVRLDGNISKAVLKWPSFAISACDNTSILHVTWVQSQNDNGHILYVRKIAEPEYRWSRPLMVNHANRLILSTDLTATAANAFSTFSYWWESPIFGTRMWSGITCQ